MYSEIQAPEERNGSSAASLRRSLFGKSFSVFSVLPVRRFPSDFNTEPWRFTEFTEKPEESGWTPDHFATDLDRRQTFAEVFRVFELRFDHFTPGPQPSGCRTVP